MKLFDAHNHLQDVRLAPRRGEIIESLRSLGVERAMVNGTREGDWGAVAELAASEPLVSALYGLHPWHVGDRSADWLDALRARLAADPNAGVGEIGLDRWVKGHDLALQMEVFLEQLKLAAAENRPVTIHCLKAWGPLQEALDRQPAPERGFLIHAYGGSAEMMDSFLKKGGFFSFNAYFLHERKGPQREVFRCVPLDRLLVETDAPDMLPPEERNRFALTDETGAPINHPGNIAMAHEALAGIRGMPVADLAARVGENFARLFGCAR